MIDYKCLLKSQRLRFAILKCLQFLPDKLMLQLQYHIKLNKSIKWNHPKRFSEWIQWYKANYRNTLMHKCVDKYEVKNFIADKGLANIVIPTLGLYNSSHDIDFEELPRKFVIKTTDGGGGQNNIICRDKYKLDIEETRRKLDSWSGKKDINPGREWAYTGICASRIIVEEYLENSLSPEAGIPDYKFLCFGGKPRYIIYDCDRYIGHKRNIYDTSWNLISVNTDCPQNEQIVSAPENLQLMLEIAGILSRDFPFVRVDLYNINGKIFFGELTFYPWSGYISFTPDSFDFELGNLFAEAIQNNK